MKMGNPREDARFQLSIPSHQLTHYGSERKGRTGRLGRYHQAVCRPQGGVLPALVCGKGVGAGGEGRVAHLHGIVGLGLAHVAHHVGIQLAYGVDRHRVGGVAHRNRFHPAAHGGGVGIP